MTNLAIIITGQLRTFFNINSNLQEILLKSKQYYEVIYVICVLNSNISDEYTQLTVFFNNLDINMKIIDYTKYSDEYNRETFNKINSPQNVYVSRTETQICQLIYERFLILINKKQIA
jgi:hypothetical protein